MFERKYIYLKREIKQIQDNLPQVKHHQANQCSGQHSLSCQHQTLREACDFANNAQSPTNCIVQVILTWTLQEFHKGG